MERNNLQHRAHGIVAVAVVGWGKRKRLVYYYFLLLNMEASFFLYILFQSAFWHSISYQLDVRERERERVLMASTSCCLLLLLSSRLPLLLQSVD